jgi:hypothetical protein
MADVVVGDVDGAVQGAQGDEGPGDVDDQAVTRPATKNIRQTGKNSVGSSSRFM